MKRKEKGWKKAVVLMLALIMCISSIVVPQPEGKGSQSDRFQNQRQGWQQSNLVCR